MLPPTSHPHPREDLPVFFVVGVGKSGTSWLMHMLNAHPEILCKGEGVFFEKGSARSLHAALESSKRVERWIEQIPWTRNLEEPRLDRIVGMIAETLLLRRLESVRRHLPRKRIVGDKSPTSVRSAVADVLENIPGAKVLHILRDGRDQTVSLLHHRWNRADEPHKPFVLSEDEQDKRKRYRQNPRTFGADGESIFDQTLLEELAENWTRVVSDARSEGRQYPGRYAEVHYEDLLAHTPAEVSRLLYFLGADNDGKYVKQAIDSASFEKLSNGRTRGQEDPTSFFRKGVAGDWKSVFTDRDRETYKNIAGDLLIRLGYEKDYDW
jgi:hypothetical protein